MNSNIKSLTTIFLISATAIFSTILIDISLINANVIKIGEFSIGQYNLITKFDNTNSIQSLTLISESLDHAL